MDKKGRGKKKKSSFKPLSVNSGFSHCNWRQGGSVNFIATLLNGLPTPQLGWFGGFLSLFLFFFGSLENGSCITVIASRGFKTAPCHGTHLPSVKPFKMD